MKTQNQNSKRINNGMLFILGIMFSGTLFLQSCSKEENINPGSGSVSASNSERRAGDLIHISHQGSMDGTAMPIYSVTIFQQANADQKVVVTFNGEENVAFIGTMEWEIPVTVLNSLLNEARARKLYNLPDETKGGAEESATRLIDGLYLNKSIINYPTPDVTPPASLMEFQRSVETRLDIGHLVNG